MDWPCCGVWLCRGMLGQGINVRMLCCVCWGLSLNWFVKGTTHKIDIA